MSSHLNIFCISSGKPCNTEILSPNDVHEVIVNSIGLQFHRSSQPVRIIMNNWSGFDWSQQELNHTTPSPLNHWASAANCAGWAKNLDRFLNFITPVYDDAERHSMYHNVLQFFIRSKTDVLNVTAFKYSLHKFRETVLHWKYQYQCLRQCTR